MNTNMKVLLTGIIGICVVATPILTSAASNNSLNAVSSATTKQTGTQTQSTTAVGTKKTDATASTKVSASSQTKSEVWTLEKIKAYNGKSGNLAYIVVNGVIYDVTGVSNWKNGSHNGLNAGSDLTTTFAKSPHSAKLLQQLKVVGKIGDVIVKTPAPTKDIKSNPSLPASGTPAVKANSPKVEASKKLNDWNQEKDSDEDHDGTDDDIDDNDEHDENEHGDDH